MAATFWWLTTGSCICFPFSASIRMRSPSRRLVCAVYTRSKHPACSRHGISFLWPVVSNVHHEEHTGNAGFVNPACSEGWHQNAAAVCMQWPFMAQQAAWSALGTPSLVTLHALKAGISSQLSGTCTLHAAQASVQRARLPLVS